MRTRLAASEQQLFERLARLVAVKSVSRAEGEVAVCVAAELAGAGFEVRRCGANVWCEIGDAPRPRLLLNSHLDTVPPGDGWTGDPWTPRIVDGRLIGLGANDAKGCVTAMMGAVLAIKGELERARGLGGTVVLALTAEEEISGNGLSTVLDQLRPLDAAIVGEPTGLTPMIAQRGLLILKGVARGRSGHPANTPTDSTDNAIMNAAADLMRLRAFDWGEEHPLLGRCHAHVTMINGGVARNVIPDACEFYLDIRTTPNQSHRALYERLAAFVRSELLVHSDRLVPVETLPDDPIVQAVLRALPERKSSGSPTMSDMVFLCGVPTVKIGPGESGRSHTADEYITAQELEAGANAYRGIIDEYFVRNGE